VTPESRRSGGEASRFNSYLKTVYSSTGQSAYGTDSFALPALGAGAYTVKLSATDLAGNAGTTTGTLTVS
jgi:hypothetical protein